MIVLRHLPYIRSLNAGIFPSNMCEITVAPPGNDRNVTKRFGYSRCFQ